MYFSNLYKYSLIIALCCGFPLNTSFATTCSHLEAITTPMTQGEYRDALKSMNKCLDKQPSVSDQQLLNDLIKQVLAPVDDTTSFDEVYGNFQEILKIPSLKKLGFQMGSYFEKYPKKANKLFADVRGEGEKYYFYYDTGRFFSHSRGIALTDKSLIWKNLTGDAQRVPFDDIKTMILTYDHGFSMNSNLSLTGWKLRINNDQNKDIRLSRVVDEAIQPLISAMIYFINFNKTSSDFVTLDVPEKEVAILAGWVTLCSEKHENQDSPIKELQLLDACFSKYGDDFKLSQTDRELLNKITTQIFEKSDVPFDEAYSNFKVLLKTHFFSALSENFKFKDNLNAEAKLFKDVRPPEEQYYFYFDTGTVSSSSRGLALTDQSVIWKNLVGSSISWKNLTGSASQLPFEKISSVSLIHKMGFQSTTGWKLRLNKDKNYDIVLSKLSTDNVELFASTIVYFINVISDANLTLQVPEETKDVLTKTFLERHPKIQSMTDSVFGAIMPEKSGE
ncbi:hypothetical protein [Candidatus Parabeggiatoa sp. HSG14]|uniref:hypothetical protein n=1 Tax=Candidatus Parabeggiatoa sp. HSG14 TaxID=3055593 RepID=UPI0025A8FB8F|nr:hypothetical protein [Thiotrichales bacterium HSG14]